jgi:pentatricopeptide repeat protein
MLAKTVSRDMRTAINLTNTFIESWSSDVDEGLFNALLEACCQQKDVFQLEVTLNLMHKLKVEPSAVTLGILVKTYGRAGQLQKVSEVWNTMVTQRKQANAVTYGCMLDSCVKCGDLKLALQVFEDVKKEGKHKNTVLYTTLIKGCSKQKDLQSALALFREMKQEMVPYNIITYNSIIDVCVNCGAVHVAEGIFQQMIDEESMAHGSSPDLITFSTLLKGYCQAGELNKAFMVLEAIRERELPCDELVFNTLIDGCVKTGDLSTGLGLFGEMLKVGAQPSTITHSILVKLYRGAGYGHQSPEAVAILYQHHGLQPAVFGSRRRRRENIPGRGAGADRRKNMNGQCEAGGPSPNNALMHSAGNDPCGTASSLCSSPDTTLSMQQVGYGWDQNTEYGAFSETQQYIQSSPTQPSGSWMIMGPYPAPVHNVVAPPMEHAYIKPKSKSIIKI